MLAQAKALGMPSSTPAAETGPSGPIVVRDRRALQEVRRLLDGDPDTAIDLETSGLDPLSGEVVGIGLSIGLTDVYIPIDHRFADTGKLRPDQLPLNRVVRELRLGRLPLIAHNAKFEYRWLWRHAGVTCRFVWDTMLAARLRAIDLPADLKELAMRELDVPDWSLPKAEIKAIQFLPVERVAGYCCKDTRYTLDLYLRQRAAPDLNQFLMAEVELKLVPVVAAMEDAGYAINPAHFAALRDRLEPEMAATLRRIRKKAGKEFNPKSPEQLQHLLYKKLGLNVTKWTESGEPSTDKQVLEAAARQHPIAAAIARYRNLSWVLSTYATFPEKADADGRYRVPFNQLDAVTGRFQSKSVTQTVPKHDEFHLRRGFVAAPGHQIVGADFNQQELRVLAGCSTDANMLGAVRNNQDLHGLAAVKVYKLDCLPDEVKDKYPAERDKVKAIQFGLIYGRGAHSLARDLGISREDAETLIADYFAQFPRVEKFIEDVHKRLVRDGYVDDMFSGRRYFPGARRKPPRGKSWHQLSEAGKRSSRALNKAKREGAVALIP